MHHGRTSGVQLGDYDIAHYAAAFGVHGYRVESEEQFAKILDEALSREARVQPGVAIIPFTHGPGRIAAASAQAGCPSGSGRQAVRAGGRVRRRRRGGWSVQPTTSAITVPGGRGQRHGSSHTTGSPASAPPRE
ncbi:thiamine pyrophosphate-dependent enzyme [Streptomyces sp. NPDC000994]